MGNNAWLENLVINGLQKLLILRRPGSPAADTINAVVDVWMDALARDARWWTAAQDAERVCEGFARIVREMDIWPQPAHLRERMPPRAPQRALPSPKTNAMAPELRAQVDAILKKPRMQHAVVTRDDLLVVLRAHIGATNGVSVRDLARRLNCEERHVRTLVSELRMDGVAVCGHPTRGYYIAETVEDVESTASFLRSRAMHSLTLESRLRKIPLVDLLGQLRLPT